MKCFKINVCSFALSLLFLLLNCCNNQEYSSRAMCFDNVEFVNSFPKVFITRGDSVVFKGINSSGVLAVVDSFLFTSSHDSEKEGLWKCYSTKDHRYLSSFFSKGHGPLEVLSSPWLSRASIFHQNDSLYTFIYDNLSGNSFVCNLTQSIDSCRTIGRSYPYKIDKEIAQCILLDSIYTVHSKFLVSEYGEFSRRKIKMYMKDGQFDKKDEKLRTLNKFILDEDSHIAALTAVSNYNPKRDLVVMVPRYTNFINIFSVNGSTNKTICIGDNIKDANMYQKIDPYINDNCFSQLDLFDDFFVVKGDKGLRNSLLFFDYDGTPLCELDVEIDSVRLNFGEDIFPRPEVLSYPWMCIDEHKQQLYLSFQSRDEIIESDIRDVLNYIKNITQKP